METLSKLLQKHRKHFIPLESNPEVFTKLIHKLGVSDSLEIQDVLSLDDPDLLAFVPRPAHALILVFPTTEAYHQRVEEEDSDRQLQTDNQAGDDILFFKQTINNACGLYAILHAVCNGEASTKFARDSTIDKIKQDATTLTVERCALALEANADLEKAYSEVARTGDTQAPDNPEDDVPYHYVCFVKSRDNGHLFQLDGARKQRIDLGATASDEDVLSDKCLGVVRSMIAKEEGNVNFGLMALVPAAL